MALFTRTALLLLLFHLGSGLDTDVPCKGEVCPSKPIAPGVVLMQMRPGAVSRQASKTLADQAADPATDPATDPAGDPATEPATEPAPEQAPAPAQEPVSLQAEIQRLNGRLDDLLSNLERRVACCSTACAERGGNVSSNGVTLPTTTTTTTTTLPTPGLCAAFGDPHFITFDGAHTTFVGNWVLWLVKSAKVWIQLLSRDSDGKLMGLAFGGEFMQGHTLVLHKETHDGPITTAFDGQVILNHTTDEFHLPGVLEAWRNVEWQDWLHNTEILTLRTRAKFDIGPWPSRFTGAPEGGIFMLKLPHNIQVTLTGVDFISAVLSMAPEEGGQGGYCGNFNGNADDDAEPVAPSWDRAVGPDLLAVPDSENMFLTPTASLLGISATRGSDRHTKRFSLEDTQKHLLACPPELREQANRQCASILDARIRQDCVFDVCMARNLESVAGTFAADILQEAVNARGVPTFLGHGECLDQAGKRFRAVGTHLRTDEACTGLLRQLATTRGVLGAQLRRGSVCQVLLEEGADPTSEIIPGGWDTDASPQGEGGRGLVSSATDDAAWNCWQLN